MKIRIQVIVEADDGATVVQEVAAIAREELRPDTLGLHLDEAKEMLRQIQHVVVERQVAAQLAQQAVCPACGQPRRHKGTHPLVVRTLFGTMRLHSPRLYHCACCPQPTRTFSPLAAALPERTTPEVVYLETKFAALMSYGVVPQ